MRESIKFTVLNPVGDDTNAEIIVDVENDVFEIRLMETEGNSSKKLFSGDWCYNLKEVFKRALEIWV